jgi:hypothetical protein
LLCLCCLSVVSRFAFSCPRHYLEESCQLHDRAALLRGKEPLVPTG